VIETSGSGLLLNVSPSRGPDFFGGYDFDLLGEGHGEACAVNGDRRVKWVGVADLNSISTDPLTRQAIAAAAYDAISRMDKIDGLVLTRVVAEAKSSERVCATVYGRAVRLTKATSPKSLPEPSSQPPNEPDEDKVLTD